MSATSTAVWKAPRAGCSIAKTPASIAVVSAVAMTSSISEKPAPRTIRRPFLTTAATTRASPGRRTSAGTALPAEWWRRSITRTCRIDVWAGLAGSGSIDQRRA